MAGTEREESGPAGGTRHADRAHQPRHTRHRDAGATTSETATRTRVGLPSQARADIPLRTRQRPAVLGHHQAADIVELSKRPETFLNGRVSPSLRATFRPAGEHRPPPAQHGPPDTPRTAGSRASASRRALWIRGRRRYGASPARCSTPRRSRAGRFRPGRLGKDHHRRDRRDARCCRVRLGASLRWTNEVIAPQDPEFQHDKSAFETIQGARMEMFQYFERMWRSAAGGHGRHGERRRQRLRARRASAGGRALVVHLPARRRRQRDDPERHDRRTHRLLENPGEWRKLAQDPHAHPAVEEIVRWTTPVIQFCRTATENYELGGTTIRRGENVCSSTLGEPGRGSVPDADVFRIDRRPTTTSLSDAASTSASAPTSRASSCASRSRNSARLCAPSWRGRGSACARRSSAASSACRSAGSSAAKGRSGRRAMTAES